MPLHVSVPGVPAATEHWVPLPAPLQTTLPCRVHAPTPTVQDPPSANPLSTTPLQSSSMPLHVSAVGEPAATEHVVPFPAPLHTSVPCRVHAPTPTEQAPPSEKPLSTTPLQSSSSELQISAVGEPAITE